MSGNEDLKNRKCPKCGFISDNPRSDFCEVCGFQFESPGEGKTICHACRSVIPEDSKICPFCGVKVSGKKLVHPYLISFNESGEKNSYPIFLPRTTIGRNPRCSIAFIGEKSISSEHCLIFYKDGKFFIRDLNSTNGVFVNGEKVSESEIKDGDVIKLGLRNFKFEVKFPTEVEK